MLRYFTTSLVFSGLGLLLAFIYAWSSSKNLSHALAATAVTALLAVLEISISFDNAIVNASWLQKMTPVWQQRFLTWGMAIAVFGMRLLLPLALVSFLCRLNPWSTLQLALFDSTAYSLMVGSVHHQILSFGGCFLILVGMRFFIDPEKTEHWIGVVERPLQFLAKLPGLGVALTLLILLGFTSVLPVDEAQGVMKAGLWAVVLFILSDGLLEFVHAPQDQKKLSVRALGKQSVVIFLYLEVLDASFSLDGVVGAFALTDQLVLITIGLGIGAFYVRSFTLLLVERKTLQSFQFLEHGAFYAILSLGLIMFISLFLKIPEYVSGGVSALLILASIVHSIFLKRRSSSKSVS